MSSLSHLWGEYLKQSDKVSNSELLKNKSSQNITFMKKMGFSPDFIEAAKIERGTIYGDLQLDWMYSWIQRQNRFFELRPKMLPIGDDGCGNFIYLYDVSNPDSQIIYMCHDPAVLMVIANSMEEFLQRILIILAETNNEQELFSSYIEKYEFSEAAMRIWKQGYYNGQNSELGFIHQKHSNSKVYANFTNAKPGAGISLSFFGKYTEIYYTNLKDVIAIEKMETDGIKKLKYKDKRAWVYFALTLPLLYFILGLIKLTPASRIAIILGVLLIIPWVIDFVRFLRKSGPRL